ncbi:MAG: GNAT family N-acetyltransferase [Mesorhizobium sp.]
MAERVHAAPVLETARAILRPHRLEDFDAYAAMWTEPAVFRFVGGKARSREESWQRLLRHFGLWSMLGFGFWAIQDRESGRFIGEAGFHELKREIVPSIEGTPEAGWSLVPEFQGHGLGTEVVSRVLAWGDATFEGARTVCLIDPDNAGSLAVARKVGYREIVRTEYGGSPILMLERHAVSA